LTKENTDMTQIYYTPDAAGLISYKSDLQAALLEAQTISAIKNIQTNEVLKSTIEMGIGPSLEGLNKDKRLDMVKDLTEAQTKLSAQKTAADTLLTTEKAKNLADTTTVNNAQTDLDAKISALNIVKNAIEVLNKGLVTTTVSGAVTYTYPEINHSKTSYDLNYFNNAFTITGVAPSTERTEWTMANWTTFLQLQDTPTKNNPLQLAIASGISHAASAILGKISLKKDNRKPILLLDPTTATSNTFTIFNSLNSENCNVLMMACDLTNPNLDKTLALVATMIEIINCFTEAQAMTLLTTVSNITRTIDISSIIGDKNKAPLILSIKGYSTISILLTSFLSESKFTFDSLQSLLINIKTPANISLLIKSINLTLITQMSERFAQSTDSNTSKGALAYNLAGYAINFVQQTLVAQDTVASFKTLATNGSWSTSTDSMAQIMKINTYEKIGMWALAGSGFVFGISAFIWKLFGK